MKGFYIEITNNLLDPKHCKGIGESIWLFLWLLDKMTSISEEGVGKVLGGKPIKYEEINKDLDVPIRTYRRWIKKLKDGGYINVIRTPAGLVISVNKAKKRFGRKSDVPKNAGDVPQVAHRCVVDGISNIRHNRDNTKTGSSSFKKPKPFYNGHEMRFAQGKWWVIEKGAWLEYADKLSKIAWIKV